MNTHLELQRIGGAPSDTGPVLSGEDWQNESFYTHMVNLSAEPLKCPRR